MKIRYRVIFIIFITLLGLTFIILNKKNAQSVPTLNDAFLKAIYAKDIPLMEKLFQDGADINVSLREGTTTPIAEAAYLGDLKVVEYLISKGARVSGNQTFPNSPIYFAIFKGHLAVVSRFLDLGVEPNYSWTDRNGGTLLIAAAQFGQLEVVKLLVKRGADINFCGNGDFSPMYRSIIYDRFSIFEFLLNKGACLNEQDRVALSEVEWEKVKSDEKYIELLKKKGCSISPPVKREPTKTDK